MSLTDTTGRTHSSPLTAVYDRWPTEMMPSAGKHVPVVSAAENRRLPGRLGAPMQTESHRRQNGNKSSEWHCPAKLCQESPKADAPGQQERPGRSTLQFAHSKPTGGHNGFLTSVEGGAVVPGFRAPLQLQIPATEVCRQSSCRTKLDQVRQVAKG